MCWDSYEICGGSWVTSPVAGSAYEGAVVPAAGAGAGGGFSQHSPAPSPWLCWCRQGTDLETRLWKWPTQNVERACACVRAQTSNPDVNVGHFPSRFPFWVFDNTALVTVTGAFVLVKSSNQINKLGPAVNSVIFQTKRSDQSCVSAITGLFMPVQRIVQWPGI